MRIIVGILFYVIMGVIIIEIARLIGKKIFKISDVYNSFLKLFKKSDK